MDHFKLVSDYTLSGDQPEAVQGLVNGVNWGLREQTLLGRHRLRQDLHHGVGDREAEPPDSGTGTQ